MDYYTRHPLVLVAVLVAAVLAGIGAWLVKRRYSWLGTPLARAGRLCWNTLVTVAAADMIRLSVRSAVTRAKLTRIAPELTGDDALAWWKAFMSAGLVTAMLTVYSFVLWFRWWRSRSRSNAGADACGGGGESSRRGVGSSKA